MGPASSFALFTGVFVFTGRGSRTRRSCSVATRGTVRSLPTVDDRATFSRLKGIVDSEESEDDSETRATTCRDTPSESDNEDNSSVGQRKRTKVESSSDEDE